MDISFTKKDNKQPEQKDKPGHGLLTHSDKQKSQKTDNSQELSTISSNIGNLNRRLRVLEERYTNLRKKSQLTDQNMLHIDKKIIEEIKTCAKNEDIKVIEKYVNMWEPVKFVTINQLKDVVEKTVASELSKRPQTSSNKIDAGLRKPDFSAAHKRLEEKEAPALEARLPALCPVPVHFTGLAG